MLALAATVGKGGIKRKRKRKEKDLTEGKEVGLLALAATVGKGGIKRKRKIRGECYRAQALR